MTNKVNYREFIEAKRRANEEIEEFSTAIGFKEDLVRITFDTSWKTPIQAKLNWSALGTVEAKTAVKFAKLLNFAYVVADGFKYNGYEIDKQN